MVCDSYPCVLLELRAYGNRCAILNDDHVSVNDRNWGKGRLPPAMLFVSIGSDARNVDVSTYDWSHVSMTSGQDMRLLQGHDHHSLIIFQKIIYPVLNRIDSRKTNTSIICQRPYKMVREGAESENPNLTLDAALDQNTCTDILVLKDDNHLSP